MDYQATKKFRLNAGAVFNHAKNDWSWRFTEREQLLAKDPTQGPLAETGIEEPGGTGSVSYDNWELNNQIDSYSELEYQQYEVTLGGTYAFTEQFYTTASVTYDKFESEKTYVYGDEDGDVLRGYFAMGYNF